MTISPSFVRLPFAFAAFASMALLFTAACGDDGGGPSVEFFDAAVPDATPEPDARPCAGEVCEGVCVDTSSDSLNCGGCGMACQSAGQICSGSLPCACPESFVPAAIGGGGLDIVQEQNGVYIGIVPFLSSTINIAGVLYTLTLETGVDYSLADTLVSGSPPAVFLGYDVDQATQSAHTAYASVSGTINFTTICEVGATGTITSVSFAEVDGLMGTVAENGCTLDYETIEFSIGESCVSNATGGSL